MMLWSEARVLGLRHQRGGPVQRPPERHFRSAGKRAHPCRMATSSMKRRAAELMAQPVLVSEGKQHVCIEQ